MVNPCLCFQIILNAKPEGNSKLHDLRKRGQSLSENQDLEQSRRQEVERTVRDTEEEWNNILKAAEDVLRNAEKQTVSDKEFKDFKTQNDSIHSWVNGHKHNLQSLSVPECHMDTEERLQITVVSFL